MLQVQAVLSQGEPCDAAGNFDTYRILQRHCRCGSLPQRGFLVYISDRSNAEITQYADFHGRDTYTLYF